VTGIGDVEERAPGCDDHSGIAGFEQNAGRSFGCHLDRREALGALIINPESHAAFAGLRPPTMSVERLQLRRDRAAVAFADRAVVELADRRDRGRAVKNASSAVSVAQDPPLVPRCSSRAASSPYPEFDALKRAQTDVQRVQLAANPRKTFSRALGDAARRVEQQRLVIAVVRRLLIGEDRVQVVGAACRSS
jgi:hypothetical protein